MITNSSDSGTCDNDFGKKLKSIKLCNHKEKVYRVEIWNSPTGLSYSSLQGQKRRFYPQSELRTVPGIATLRQDMEKIQSQVKNLKSLNSVFARLKEYTENTVWGGCSYLTVNFTFSEQQPFFNSRAQQVLLNSLSIKANLISGFQSLGLKQGYSPEGLSTQIPQRSIWKTVWQSLGSAILQSRFDLSFNGSLSIILSERKISSYLMN